MTYQPHQSEDATVMTDRELLERAAKAAGLELSTVVDPPTIVERYENGGLKWVKGWDPLTDDGDALRLAVKLRLDVLFCEGFQEIKAEAASVYAHGHAIEDYAADMTAATRRAIVRAAAALSQKEQTHA